LGEKKTLKFDIDLSNIEKLNPLFSKATVKVLYTGNNRNNTYFSKESVENALPSIFGIPIIGEYLKEKDNFGSHGGKIVLSDQGIEYIQTTQPYGFVPESANIHWESITEEKGDVHDYLVIDDAYLWTGRYEELDDLLNEPYGQSMEIEVEDGEFEEIDGQQTYNVKSFVFSALCILGIEKNGEGEVEPCFESASIAGYSLNKDDFKKQFKQMLSELKFSLKSSKQVDNTKEGGLNKLDDKLELLKKYSISEEDLKAKNIDLEKFSLEDLESKLKEIKSKNDAQFALTGEQFVEEMQNVLSKEKIKDDWDYEYSRYRYVDYDESMTQVFAIDRADQYKLYGFAYSVNGDAVTINFDTKARKKVQFVDFEGADGTAIDEIVVPSEDVDFAIKKTEKQAEEKYSKDIQTEQDKYSALEEKVSSLEKFKADKTKEERRNAEEALFSRFESELEKDEIEAVKVEASKFSIEDLESHLFALVGKKKAKFAKVNSKKDSVVKISTTIETHDEGNSLYGGLFDKFNK
jgi:hypothetical protein